MASKIDDEATGVAVETDPVDYVPAPTLAFASEDADVGPSRSWWGCRRRARILTASGASTAYRDLVLAGRGLCDADRAKFEYMAWWSEAITSNGTRVFVLAPRGADGELEGSVDMWRLLTFAVSLMNNHVVDEDKKFAIVWIQTGDPRVQAWSAWQFRRSLHDKYFSNLEAIHVVHPSWSLRCIQLFTWLLSRSEAWECFYNHERIEFLDAHMDLKKLGLPTDVYEYDQVLDKEADLMSEQAALQMGSYVGGHNTDGGHE